MMWVREVGTYVAIDPQGQQATVLGIRKLVNEKYNVEYSTIVRLQLLPETTLPLSPPPTLTVFDSSGDFVIEDLPEHNSSNKE